MNEEYEIIYTPLALQDIKSIYWYISINLKAQQTAEKQVNRIRKKIRSLNFMPERCVRVDWEPWHSMNIRKLSVDNYLVFYRIDKENQIVTIIRILYAGRDIENIIKDSLEEI